LVTSHLLLDCSNQQDNKLVCLLRDQHSGGKL
jgi:hypothetical protein